MAALETNLLRLKEATFLGSSEGNSLESPARKVRILVGD